MTDLAAKAKPHGLVRFAIWLTFFNTWVLIAYGVWWAFRGRRRVSSPA